ncbi:MAG: bifunctional riboflavin kinase/FAD synthetase [Lachnospiraceae bacterium]|jgi:riboflavin kinase/FMN adenylyltransferase|nr:bifunctional riboflavin kinase/FAD synthetase [Lachnospiraceae bacterium]
MEYITGKKEFYIPDPTVVTIGKFDGRHRGHQKLMAAMRRLAEQYGYKTAVFTFATAPGAVVGGAPLKVITTNEERRANLAKTGIDYLVEYPFDSQVSHMDPEEFVREILIGRMNGRAVVAGTDCGFGYKRAGNAELLKALALRYGFTAEIIEKEQDCHRDISSTYVKEMLDKGHMEKANELLGQPYGIHGIVVHGNGMGDSKLGFPTANLIPPPEKYLPAFGVYVSRVTTGDKTYSGVTNIGRKPTIEGENPVGVETFLLDYHGDLYGQYIEVCLLKQLRPEKKFAGLEELKAQIGQDKANAAAYWKRGCRKMK